MWALSLTLAVVISCSALSAAQQSDFDDSITFVASTRRPPYVGLENNPQKTFNKPTNNFENRFQNDSSKTISLNTTNTGKYSASDTVFGNQRTSTTPTSLGTKDISKPNCECVPYYLCRKKTTSTEETVIDLSGDNGCPKYLDVCCMNSDKLNEIVIPPFTERKGCGYRHPNGIGFKITGNTNNETQFGEFPWMVAIMRVNYEKRLVYLCGGSLIHERVVLTAGQCIHRMEPNELKIRAGEWDTQTRAEILPHQERKVEKVIAHEKFHAGILANDVALLIMSHPFDLTDNVDVVCLPEQSAVFDRSRCIVTGWGKDKFGAEDQNRVILKKLELPLVPHDTCQNNFRKNQLGKYFVLHRSFVCAGDGNDYDRCKGDGGGPLVCPSKKDPNRYQQVGIVSERIDCGQNGTPATHANVIYARNWIDEQMASYNLDQIDYTL